MRGPLLSHIAKICRLENPWEGNSIWRESRARAIRSSVFKSPPGFLPGDYGVDVYRAEESDGHQRRRSGVRMVVGEGVLLIVSGCSSPIGRLTQAFVALMVSMLLPGCSADLASTR